MSCTVSKDELKKSLALLWKNIQDNYAKKSELPTVTSSVVVVDRKEDIVNYSKNILYNRESSSCMGWIRTGSSPRL